MPFHLFFALFAFALSNWKGWFLVFKDLDWQEMMMSRDVYSKMGFVKSFFCIAHFNPR